MEFFCGLFIGSVLTTILWAAIDHSLIESLLRWRAEAKFLQGYVKTPEE